MLEYFVEDLGVVATPNQTSENCCKL